VPQLSVSRVQWPFGLRQPVGASQLVDWYTRTLPVLSGSLVSQAKIGVERRSRLERIEVMMLRAYILVRLGYMNLRWWRGG
jgi:hypothetical protein